MISTFDEKLSSFATRTSAGNGFKGKLVYCRFRVENDNLKNFIQTAGSLKAFMYGYTCLFRNAYYNMHALQLDILRDDSLDFNPLKHYALGGVEITKIIL
jgi:hypothetical protein